MAKIVFRIVLKIGDDVKEFTKDNGLRKLQSSREAYDSDGTPVYGLLSQYGTCELIDREGFIINRVKNGSMPATISVQAFRDYYSDNNAQKATNSVKIGSYIVYGSGSINIDIYSSKVTLSLSDKIQGFSKIKIQAIALQSRITFQAILDMFKKNIDIPIIVKFRSQNLSLSTIGWSSNFFSMTSGNLYEKLDNFCKVLCANGYIDAEENLIINSLL